MSKTEPTGGASLPLDEPEDEGASALEEAWSKPGAVLGERFVVERRLGSGGMGYVVAARHPELEERVAIKLLRPGRALSRDARNRLVREARAAARIRSPHVVRILDVVSKGEGAPYLVMEYLAGETLAELIARTRRLSVERAVDIVIQACEPLAEAHRNGTIHRDLKPSNLFLTALPGRACFVKVLDFGIAKTRDAGEATLTQSQALLASPAYASPEQLRASKEVDERSDIWSLGVILYECLTGRLPFDGRALAVLSSEILRDAPAPPRAHRTELPEALERVILRCLEKDPARRFDGVEALVFALERFAPSSAAECLEYVRDLGPRPDVPDAPDEAPTASTRHRSTLTHASVASPALRTSSKRTGVWLLAGASAMAAFIVMLSRRPDAASSSVNGSTATTSVARPLPAFTPEPPAATSHELQRVSAAPSVPPKSSAIPEPRASHAKLVTLPPTARTAAPGATSRASAKPTANAPSPLEALPLNDLIDGRK